MDNSWGDREFLIAQVAFILMYFNPWGRDSDKVKDAIYNTYQKTHTRRFIFFYPTLSVYKFFWALSYISAVVGYTCSWIYLTQKTDWYTSIISLTIANFVTMHFWNIAYWRWHNDRSLGTMATVFLWATSGAIAAMVGFQAYEQGNNLALWIGGFGGWAIYFFWITYVTGVVLSTDWRLPKIMRPVPLPPMDQMNNVQEPKRNSARMTNRMKNSSSRFE
jgi:hypothetical protein